MSNPITNHCSLGTSICCSSSGSNKMFHDHQRVDQTLKKKFHHIWHPVVVFEPCSTRFGGCFDTFLTPETSKETWICLRNLEKQHKKSPSTNPRKASGQLLGRLSRSSKLGSAARQLRGVRGVASEAKGPTTCGSGDEFLGAPYPVLLPEKTKTSPTFLVERHMVCFFLPMSTRNT